MAARRLRVGDRVHYLVTPDTSPDWQGVVAEVTGFMEGPAGLAVKLRVIDVPVQRYTSGGQAVEPWEGQEYKGGLERTLRTRLTILIVPVPAFPDVADADKWLEAQAPTSDL